LERNDEFSLSFLISGFATQLEQNGLVRASCALNALNAHSMHEASLKFCRDPGPREGPFHQDALGEPPSGHFLVNFDIAQGIKHPGLLLLRRARLVSYGHGFLPSPVRLLICLHGRQNRKAKANRADGQNNPGDRAVVKPPESRGRRQV
jgi:hypothetical protein